MESLSEARLPPPNPAAGRENLLHGEILTEPNTNVSAAIPDWNSRFQLSGVADAVVGLVTVPANVSVDAKVWSIFEL